MKTRLLTRKDIQGFLTMATCIEAVEGAFADLAKGNAIMPQRTPIKPEGKGGVALFMPAYIPSSGALGAKVVTVYSGNVTKYQLPAIFGTYILLDENTGFPISIMEGGYLTAMRTGAATGVSCKYMARKASKVLMIFGTGVQAIYQVFAVHEARPLKRILAYSIDPPDAKDKFSAAVKGKIGIKVEHINDPADGVGQADIVVLATSAPEPVVNGNWFKPGTHISGIGSHSPGAREIDTLTVQKSRIVCDLIDACKAEAGDFIIPAQKGEWDWGKVAGSLGDVITGKIKGRESDDEITLFKSVGLAIQDMSVARAVYDEALKQGIGTDFEF
jgi:ornithine cyclodeaminase/alanine dehydrogenase